VAEMSVGGVCVRQARPKRAISHDSRWWRSRAEVCRAIAETFSNPETRGRMSALADDYERRAEAAELLETAPGTPREQELDGGRSR
jgi:hypothetical protein